MPFCTCGHADDEHERRAGHLADCTVEIDGEKCACVLYEHDGDPDDFRQPEYVEGGGD